MVEIAWTTPRTWITGETVTAALLNTMVRDNLNYLYDNVNAWSAWTVTITQSNTPSKTTNVNRFMQVGKLAIAHMQVAFTSAGTASNVIVCNVPVTMRTYGQNVTLGSFFYVDAGTQNIAGIAIYASTTTLNFIHDANNSPLGQSDVTIANTDTMSMFLVYEAA